MNISMEMVRAALDCEEPDYPAAARLGAGALPHLWTLVRGGDAMLASKAAYLAGLIGQEKSAPIIEEAARSPHAIVRVAAAGAARHLPGATGSVALGLLLDDDDIGIRKVALRSIHPGMSEAVQKKVTALAESDTNAAIREISSQVLQNLRQ